MTPDPMEAARRWNAGRQWLKLRRRHLFDRLFAGLMLMALFPYGANCYKAYLAGDWGLIAIHTLLYSWGAVPAFFRRIPFPVRCWLVLAWFFILGIFSFFLSGVLGGAWVYLICFSAFGVIFWGGKVGLLTLAMNTVVVLGVWALGLQYGFSGAHAGIAAGALALEPVFSFLGVAMPYLFLLGFITLSLGGLISALERANSKNERELSDAREALALKTSELQAMEQRMARMEKLKNLGVVADKTAHDLNNMLTGLATYPEVLLMDGNLPDATVKGLKMIQASGSQASAVVSDLLTISRGTRAEHQVVNLNTVVERYLRAGDFARAMGEFPGVDLETRMDPELANMKGSHIHLEKTVMNLILSGARAASSWEGEGRIHISTGNAGQGGDAEVRLTIFDNGPGIAEPDLLRIDEPFYTIPGRGTGSSGLGLTLVRHTVEDHQGRMTVVSDDQGTRFDLYFPAVEAVAEPTAPVAEKPQDIQGMGQRILIVDDLPDQRKIAGRILQNLGYEVSTAGDGMEAVNFITKHPMDLVVLDVVLEPGISGLETFRRMRRVYPRLKTVIASGYPDQADVEQMLALGAGQVVKKPYTVYEMGAAVKAVLAA